MAFLAAYMGRQIREGHVHRLPGGRGITLGDLPEPVRRNGDPDSRELSAQPAQLPAADRLTGQPDVARQG